nr:Ig-like domain-containing protein [uncultured Methanobrevibacter sp.]
MKINPGLLLVIVILAILSMTCIAAENVTDSEIAKDINVTFSQQMWQEDLEDINVELPQNASGDFSVKINDEVIYNQTITEKSFKVPVKLPNRSPEFVITIWPPLDCRYYKVSAFYNSIDLNITTPLKIMKSSPDYNMLFFPEEILKNDKYAPLIAFPRSANGTVELYIDDELLKRAAASPVLHFEDNPFSKLPLGKHTFKIIYYGDSYYHPFNKTFNFTVVNVKITVPETINIGHDDCISVEASKNTEGNVRVYLDDELIANSKTEDGQYVLSLENYISYRNNEIKVVYTSKEFSRTKTQPIKMTYDFDVWQSYFNYGEKNIIEVTLPDTLNNKLLKMQINGKEYKFIRSAGVVNNIVEIDISRLGAGNYSLFISYAGDSKYYPLNKTFNFTVDYAIKVPYDVEYKDSSKAYLRLPEDARGDLIININGKLFGQAKLNRGYAQITMGALAPGTYNITARYCGNDYNVSDYAGKVYVSPKIDLTYRFSEGEDKYIILEVPKTCRGYVIFDIDGKDHKVAIKNGIAKYSLKNLKAGEHDISVDYYGEDGHWDLSNWRVVTVSKAKLKVSAEATFKGITVKIKLLNKNGKAMANKKVTIKFNGKTYKVKTNAKGIATFKKSLKLKNKKYNLKVSYMSSKLVKKLKVKPITLKVSKTGKKLIVKATINKKAKNKVVRVKINSKTYSLKTNSKGIVKVIVKKPKTITAIKATYLKQSVKII